MIQKAQHFGPEKFVVQRVLPMQKELLVVVQKVLWFGLDQAVLKDFLRSEENWQVQGKPLLKYKLDVQITDSHLNVPK